jgi:guanylate kinase
MSNEVDVGQIQRRGLMLVLSSPSGAGKTTLSRQLLDNDKQIQLSVSATTRARRTGERDGVDYHFVDTATFSGMIERGEFLEHARVFDHFYGTPSAPVEAALMAGRDVLFDIDWQGTQQLKEKAGSDLVTVFILPPSTRDLERRLITRAQDSMEVVQKRMA